MRKSRTSADTAQMRVWAGDFGRKYTNRNALLPQELDQLYVELYGVSRTDLNRRFLQAVHPNARVLEVGCNVGIQLSILQSMGYRDLMGVELQEYAIREARKRTTGIKYTRGSALDLPVEDESHDLVFTSGVLIHISPREVNAALAEIHRASRRFIWGFEYYASEYDEVVYRGNRELLWKGDFARMYLAAFSDLRLVKEERLQYTNSENQDSMFLLEKIEAADSREGPQWHADL